MKKFILSIMVLCIVAFPAFAESPVLTVTCAAGAGQYGNEIVFTLSKAFKYGKLTIKRAPSGSDFVKDLSAFLGGIYRLDLAAKGGISGYTLEYAAKEASVFESADAALSCLANVPQPSN